MDTSNWLAFGPIDQMQIGKLTEALEQAHAEYKVEISEEHLEDHKETIRNRIPTQHPTFDGLGSFYYLRVPLKNCLIIKADLEKLGFSINDDHPEQDTHSPEYLCRKCQHKSDTPGFCPNDRTVLLEFSDWVKHHNSRRDFRFLKIVGIIAFIISVIVFVFK